MAGVKQTRISLMIILLPFSTPLGCTDSSLAAQCPLCRPPSPLSGESTQIPVAPGSICQSGGFVSDPGLQKVVGIMEIADSVIQGAS